MTDRRPIGDPSETDMPNPRLTCLIDNLSANDGDPSETDMPNLRLTCLIDNQSANDMYINKQTLCKNKYI